jgi:hypothetical protein
MKEIEVYVTRVTRIAAEGSLDSIIAIWQDLGPNKGQVTIICWGSAWTCYFGGMGCDSIQEFFAGCSTSYLVNKLGITKWLKSSKAHDVYLARLIEAVKTAIKPRTP